MFLSLSITFICIYMIFILNLMYDDSADAITFSRNQHTLLCKTHVNSMFT